VASARKQQQTVALSGSVAFTEGVENMPLFHRPQCVNRPGCGGDLAAEDDLDAGRAVDVGVAGLE